jgi:hypothetical protein
VATTATDGAAAACMSNTTIAVAIAASTVATSVGAVIRKWTHGCIVR